MRVLSSAFYRLKTIIPWVPHDTKLSKLDTLRLARNYISYLSATLAGESVNDISNKMPHPQKMVRKFSHCLDFHLNDLKISKWEIVNRTSVSIIFHSWDWASRWTLSQSLKRGRRNFFKCQKRKKKEKHFQGSWWWWWRDRSGTSRLTN